MLLKTKIPHLCERLKIEFVNNVSTQKHTQSGVRVCGCVCVGVNAHHAQPLTSLCRAFVRAELVTTFQEAGHKQQPPKKKRRRRRQSFALGSGHFAWLRWPGQVSRLAAANASKTHTRQKKGERKNIKKRYPRTGRDLHSKLLSSAKSDLTIENRAETKLKPSSVGCEAK